MRRILFALVALFAPLAVAQPTVDLTGSLRLPGSAPLLCGTTVTLASDADYTLLPSQFCNSLNVISGVSLTATRKVVAPLYMGGQFTITNATTGGHDIQFIGASGAGVTIPNGQTMIVNSPDGTKYVAASAASGSTLPVTANLIAGDGAGNGADSGIAPASVLKTSACNGVSASGVACALSLSGLPLAAVYDFTPTGTTPGTAVKDLMHPTDATRALAWPSSNAPTQTNLGVVYNGLTTAPLNVPTAVGSVAAVSIRGVQQAEDYAGGGLYIYPRTYTLFSGSTPSGGSIFDSVRMATGIGDGSFYSPQIIAYGVYQTSSLSDVANVPQMWTWAPGSPDKLAINDTYVSGYLAQNSSAAAMAAPYQLFGWNGGQNAMGTFQIAALWSSVPTAAQLKQFYQVISGLDASKGITKQWRAQATTMGPQLGCGIDSHTAGSGSNTYCSTTNMPALNGSPSVVVLATSGKLLVDSVPELPEVLYENFGPGFWAYLLDGATNDMLHSTLTTAQIEAMIVKAASTVHKQGGKFITQTYFDMCPSGVAYVQSQTINAWLRANWNTFADAISDVGADKVLGLSGNSCTNTTYWDSSKFHLTPAGKTLEGVVPQAAWNNLTGSTAQAPTTITTSVTLTSGQTYVEASCASACTVTLPDATNNCEAPNGFAIHSAGNGVVTVLPAGTDTVDGSSSALIVANGATLRLDSVFNGNVSAPSCAWKRRQPVSVQGASNLLTPNSIVFVSAAGTVTQLAANATGQTSYIAQVNGGAPFHSFGANPNCAGVTCASQYNVAPSRSTTTLSSDITNSQTTIDLADATKVSLTGCGLIAYGSNEYLCWNGVSGNTLQNISRGQYGTTAGSAVTGSTFKQLNRTTSLSITTYPTLVETQDGYVAHGVPGPGVIPAVPDIFYGESQFNGGILSFAGVGEYGGQVTAQDPGGQVAGYNFFLSGLSPRLLCHGASVTGHGGPKICYFRESSGEDMPRWAWDFATNGMRFYGISNASHFAAIKADPTADYELKLPPTQGGAGTTPQNDGSGNLTWTSGYSGSKTAGSCNLTITNGLITAVSGC